MIDLEALSIQLSKDPANYADEYNSVVRAYASMIDLPVQCTERIKQFISILSLYIFKIKSEFPSLAIRHLETTTNDELKKELVKLVTMFYQKQLITPMRFFELYLNHCDKLEIKVAMCHSDIASLHQFFSYLESGNERQKNFSLLMIAFIYEKVDLRREVLRSADNQVTCSMGGTPSRDVLANAKSLESKCVEIISASLFTTPKLTKIAMLYFLCDIDFCTDDAAKIVEKIGESGAETLCKKLMRSIRAKDDVREVRILKYKIISTLKKYYGINMPIGQHLLKLIDPTKKDIKDVLGVIMEAVEENEVLGVIDKILSVFCCEHKEDDFIAYGLNLLREFVIRFGVGEYVASKISFKPKKTKSVFYAHSMLMKAIKKKDVSSMEIGYIKRKALKEDKVKMVQQGRLEAQQNRKERAQKKSSVGSARKKMRNARGPVKRPGQKSRKTLRGKK